MSNRLLIRGTFSAGDIWQTSVAFRSAGGSNLVNQFQLQAFLNDDTTGGTWATVLTALLKYANSTVATVSTRAEYRNAVGHVLQSAERAIQVFGTQTADGTSLPSECAVVVSLRSTNPGPRARGRMYLPLNQPPRTGDGKAFIGSVNTGTICTDTKAMFTKLVAAANAAGSVSDFSPGIQSYAAGLDTFNILTQLRVGNVIDAQRRRRNKIGEAFSSLNWP